MIKAVYARRGRPGVVPAHAMMSHPRRMLVIIDYNMSLFAVTSQLAAARPAARTRTLILVHYDAISLASTGC